MTEHDDLVSRLTTQLLESHSSHSSHSQPEAQARNASPDQGLEVVSLDSFRERKLLDVPQDFIIAPLVAHPDMVGLGDRGVIISPSPDLNRGFVLSADDAVALGVALIQAAQMWASLTENGTRSIEDPANGESES